MEPGGSDGSVGGVVMVALLLVVVVVRMNVEMVKYYGYSNTKGLMYIL